MARFTRSCCCWLVATLVVVVAVTADRSAAAAAADRRQDGAAKPIAPVPSCVIHNWEMMTCSWQKHETSINADSGVDYKFRRFVCSDPERCKPENNTNYSEPCPAPGEQDCTWSGSRNYDKFSCYCVLMFANSSHGTDVRHLLILQSSRSFANVKPKAVSNLIAFSATSTTAEVQYELSNHRPCHLLCRMNFTGDDGSAITMKHEVKQNDTSIRVDRLVTNLRPSTNYNVTVECRPVNESNEIGYWSDPSSINFTTLPDVPASAPKLAAGSFRSLERPGLRDVSIFWQPIPREEQNGKIIKTCVRYCVVASNHSTDSSELQMENQPLSNNSNSNSDTANYNATDAVTMLLPCASVCVDGNRNSCVLSNLSTTLDFLVDVNSNNSVGFNRSLNLRRILIPATNNKPDLPKVYSAARNNDSTVTVHWLPIAGAVQYTVYWCEQAVGSSGDCAVPVRWQTADGSLTSLNIGSFNGTFGFVMSVEFANSTLSGAMHSSGMPPAWSHCVYNANLLPAMPLGLRLHQYQTERSLTVEWKTAECAISGHVSHFTIEYCRQDQCKIKTRETLNVTATTSAVTSATIPGLEPERSYRIRVKSWSYSGESDYTEWIVGTVIASAYNWETTIIVAGVLLAVLVASSIIAFIWMRIEYIKQWLHIPIITPDSISEYRRKLVSVSSGDSSSSSSSSKSREASPDIVSILSDRTPSYEKMAFIALKQTTKLANIDTSIYSDSGIPEGSSIESDRLVDGYLTPTGSPSPQSAQVVTHYSECTFTTETTRSSGCMANSSGTGDGKPTDDSGNSENVANCSFGYAQLDTGSDEELSVDESNPDEYLHVQECDAVGASVHQTTDQMSSAGNYTQCQLDNSEDYEEDLTLASPLQLFPIQDVSGPVRTRNPNCRILPPLSGNISTIVPNYIHVGDLALGSDEDGPDVVVVDGSATGIGNNDSGTSGVVSDHSDYAVIGVAGNGERVDDGIVSYSIVQGDNFSDVSEDSSSIS